MAGSQTRTRREKQTPNRSRRFVFQTIKLFTENLPDTYLERIVIIAIFSLQICFRITKRRYI